VSNTTQERRKIGRKSKRKGKRGEREVAKFLCDRGLSAKRTGWRQTFGGTGEAPDVTCGDLQFEVKYKESNPKRLWDELGKHDALWLRRNGMKWLVVLDAVDYVRLIGGVK